MQFISLKRLKFLVLLLLMLPMAVNAGVKSAERLFNKFDFEGAAQVYEKYYKKHPGDIEIAERIATCYRILNRWEEAESWYQIVASNAAASAENVYYYAQAARWNENYAVSNEMFTKHYQMTGDENSKNMVLTQVEFDEIYKPKGYSIEITEINTDASDFGPALYNGELYFTSNRKEGRFQKEPADFWSERTFLEMYKVDTAKLMENGAVSPWGLPKINSHYHEGPVAFHPVTGDIYLTRSNYIKGTKANRSMDNTVKLKIFRLKKTGDTWESKIVDAVDFNSDEYSVGHVSFSDDGNTMFFASDKPGGIGGTDIYYATKSGDVFTNPQPMGPGINSIGNDMYPNQMGGKLYFASSGHRGLGGLDLFEVNLDGTGLRNLGAPINSNFDDFAMVFSSEELTSGFFSSNRPGKGEDDIYKFVTASCPMKILVYDVATGMPLSNATVKLNTDEKEYKTNALGEVRVTADCSATGSATMLNYMQEKIDLNTPAHDIAIGMKSVGNMMEVLVLDKETNMPINLAKVTLNGLSYMTDASGFVRVITQSNMDYKIRVDKELNDSKKHYYPEAGKFNTGTLNPGATLGLTAYLKMYDDAPVKIDNIYYDLDKFFIRPDAAGELNNLLSVMKKYPTMEIALGSHTDCRMPMAYNQTLSENRAKAAMNYLASRGISKSRMTYKGYGETQTVNGCDCECDKSVGQIGVSAFRDCEDRQVLNCSDEDHQANRRTVFAITKF